MVTAGHGEALPQAERRQVDRDLEASLAADAYLEHAGGDVHAALILAVADGIEIARLVSRGFARWGQQATGR